MKSRSTLKSCNRVCNSHTPSQQEIHDVLTWFGNIDFTWAVDNDDIQTHELLKQQKFTELPLFPAMKIELKKVQPTDYGNEITVKAVEPQDIPTWAEIVAISFSSPLTPINKDQILYVIDYFIKHKIDMILYLGYFQSQPVATSMMIRHGNIISLHWISTLPEFRNKGAGFAVTHQALINAKNQGCSEAILLSSPQGKSLYDHIGFKQYACYRLYSKPQQ